jgi:hypothetical protein
MSYLQTRKRAEGYKVSFLPITHARRSRTLSTCVNHVKVLKPARLHLNGAPYADRTECEFVIAMQGPLVVLHEHRCSRGPGRYPASQQIMRAWNKAGVLWTTPPGSNDDWYWCVSDLSRVLKPSMVVPTSPGLLEGRGKSAK